jgi:hypothetical protein
MNTSHELNHLPLPGDEVSLTTFIKEDNRLIIESINFDDGNGKIMGAQQVVDSKTLFPIYVAGYNFQEIQSNPTFPFFINESQDICRKNAFKIIIAGTLASGLTITKLTQIRNQIVVFERSEPFDPTLNTRNTGIELQDSFIAYSSFYLAIMACLVLFNNRNNKIIDNNQAILNGITD